MSLSNEEQFNEEWRKVFEDAAESPSDELWDSITRRLDEEDTTPVIPLWPRAKPWAYGVAAAVITLLVGWWAMQSIENAGLNRPNVSQTTSPVNAPGPGDQLAQPGQNGVPATAQTAPDNAQPEGASEPDQTLAANRPMPSEQRPSTIPKRQRSATAGTPESSGKGPAVLAPESGVQSERLFAAQSRRANRQSGAALEIRPIPSEQTPMVAQSAELSSEQTADTRLAYEAAYIKSRSTLARKPAPISRIIWYRAPETTIEPQEKGRAKKEYWAALTATPMSFNPMASVQSNYSQAYASFNGVQQSTRQSTSSSVQNQAQISMAWQASSGVMLSKHWSVEAGIQYLNGRSQAQNNAAVTNAFTNQTENLLVNAVRNSSPSIMQDAMPQKNNSFLPSGLDKNNLTDPQYVTVIAANQVVSNDFQYIQVPVQIGYHLLPEHRLSYSLLGGLMANVFLKNTINDALEVNPADQIYRPAALAGTAGLRINYHPTHHWSGSLTGSYQQAIQNGTQSDAQLQVRPQAVGVGFGLNYHF